MSRFSKTSVLVAVLLVSLCGAATLPYTPVINSITPSKGSFAGGTQIYILGAGLLGNGVQGTTTVYVGLNKCVINSYRSSDSQIVCVTPPATNQISDNTQLITVAIATVDVSAVAVCIGYCMFNYQSGVTPYLATTSVGTTQGRPLDLFGSLKGIGAGNYTVVINSKTCPLIFDTTAATLEGNYWATSYVNCTTPDNAAGLYNISVNVKDATNGLGDAIVNINAYGVSGNIIYETAIFPQINSVTPQVSGSNGGQTVVISGSGFTTDCSNTVISLGAASCTVVSCTSSTITCVAGKAAQVSAPIPSTTGLTYKFWINAAGPCFCVNAFDPKYNPRYPAQPDVVQTSLNGLQAPRINVGPYTLQQLEGYFVAPLTGNYAFLIASDDYSDLYISPNSNPANLTLVAFSDGFRASYWDTLAQNSSNNNKVISLVQNQRYYIRARQQNSGGLDFLSVALRIFNTAALKTPQEIQYLSVRERQAVTFSTTIVREIQRFVITGVSTGSFAFVGAAANPIDVARVDASYLNSVVVAALKVVHPSCAFYGVDHTLVNSIATYTITFNCPTYASRALLAISNVNLAPATFAVGATFQVQAPSVPLQGFVSLGYKNIWTSPLNLTAGAGVFNAFTTLPSAGLNVISYSGNWLDGGVLVVEFQTELGSLPLITVDATNLLGAGVSVTVKKQQEGSLDYFYDPVPPQFFEVGPVSQPVVQLTVNNLKATCQETYTGALSSACAFVYNTALTPSVVSVTPSSSSPLLPGDSLAISGSGFGTDAALVSVTLGNAPCSITSISDGQIACVLGSGTQGSASVQVLHKTYGTATLSGVPSFSLGFRVDSVSLLEDGIEGGAVTTIRGTGFSVTNSDVITIGGATCVITSSTTSSVSCTVPPLANRPSDFSSTTYITVLADVVVNGAVFPNQFVYNWALTPRVTAASPSKISAGRDNVLTLSVSWSSDVSLNVVQCTKIQIGSTFCVNPSYSSDGNTVQCSFPRGTVFPFADQVPLPPKVQFCRQDGGYYTAAVDSNVLIELALRVTAIAPASVSVFGGTPFTITGAGFSELSSRLSVSFNYAIGGQSYSLPLTISSSTYNTISLVFPGIPQAQLNGNYLVSISGTVSVVHNFVSAQCPSSVCSSLQAIQDVTPVTFSVSPAIVSSGTLLTVSGNLFTSATTLSLDSIPCGSVQVISSSTLTCVVPELEAGTYAINVVVPGLGNAAGWPTPITVTQPLVFSSLSIQGSSMAGGQTVTLRGSGFSLIKSRNIVAVGGNSSVITAASYSAITFVTPALVAPSTTLNITASVSVSVQHGKYVTLVSSSDCSAISSCQIIYSPSFTPTYLGVFPGSGYKGTNVRISVLAASAGPVSGLTVSIGGTPCVVTSTAFQPSGTNSFVYCTLGDTAAGIHPVYVTRAGYGLALNAAAYKFVSLLLVSGVSAPASLNFGGGDLITITGQGFGSRNANGTGIGSLVSVCNTACSVLSSTYTSVQCVTSPLNTKASVQSFNNVPTSILTGAAITSGLANAFDNQFNTYYSGSLAACTFNYDLGAFTNALLTQIRVFPRLGQARLMAGGVFSVSVDGVTYTNVTYVPTANEGWNTFNLQAPIETRYIRYYGLTRSYCQVAELQFIGYPFQTASQSTASSSVCAVSVGNLPTGPNASQGQWLANATWYPVPPSSNYQVIGAANSILSNSSIGFVTFNTASTPLVTGVSPLYGSALGGTVLTIQLTSLPATSNLSVLVNGYPCTVLSTTSTSISCQTAPRGAIWYNNTIVVGFTSQGKFFPQSQLKSGVQFSYLDKWSALTTWENERIPIAGDTVIIPSGQAVLLDVSPPELFALFVRGVLIFDRQDLTLDASYIWVSGGRMEVGTESDPFLQNAVITLHGDRYKSIELPNIGSKVLCVSDATFSTHIYGPGVNVPIAQRGVLDIHGKPRLKVWTKVAAPASVGATSIVAQEAVDFQPGEKIVITSSSNNFREAEEVVVDYVESDSVTIHFTPALKFERTALIYNYNGESIDMRPEIGLLTRNVVIQGDSNSDAQLFGAHTIAAGGGTLRVENTEVRKCGQAFNLGRYCLHFHMAGVRPLNYFKYNSIHNSFQRATTVHGTSYSNVIGNFAYHIMGHTYFVEDGAEMNNLFEGNLGVYTLQSFASLASDVKPATFWTSSPSNFWRSNIAAGSTHFGYWFELPGNPGGPSFTTTICPNSDHLGEFFNNTAHSNGGPGLRIYPRYTPLLNPCGGGASEPTYFYNFTSFRNGLGIFTKHGGDLHHINAKLIENNGNEVQWLRLDQKYSATNANFVNLLAVAHTNPAVTVDKAAMWLPQSEYFYVSGATFVNYKNAGALSGCFECQLDQELKQGGYTYRFDGLKWDNTYKRTRWTWPFKDIFYDLDGSLTGIVNGTTTEYRAFNAVPECPSGGLQYDNGLVCNSNVRVRRLQIDGQTPTELNFLRMGVNSTAGFGTIDYLPKEISGWVIPIVTSYRYNMSFISLIDFFTLNLRYSEPEYLDVPNEWALLAFNYTNYRYTYQVLYSSTTRSISPISAINQLQPTDYFGTSRLASKTSWEIMMTSNALDSTLAGSAPGPFAVRTSAVACAPGSCALSANITWDQPTLWTESASWSSGVVPVAGQNVNIEAGKYIIFNIDSFVAGNLVVYGRFEFDDLQDHTFTAATILVWGMFSIGTDSRPFQHIGKIILTGNRYSPSLVAASNLKFDLGNKLIANFGVLSFSGKVPNTKFLKLAATANAGDKVLSLSGVVCDWSQGDSLVLTSTDYDTNEVETVTIDGISSDCTQVFLTSPLQYKHFASSVPTGTGASVSLASYVGHLSRRIRVSGQLSDASDTYGAHVVTADAVLPTGTKFGSTYLKGVGFDACGQQGLATACLQFTYTTKLTSATAPINVVDGCSFKNSFNYGIQSQNTYGLILRNNVLHRTFRNGIDVDPASQLIVVDYNLIAGNYRSPDYTNQWVQPFAAFYIDTASFVSITGNVAGGCNDTAFVVRGDLCTAATPTFMNNEAHSAMIGLFILSSGTTCLKATSFTAWKCSHIGIFTIDQTSNIQLVNPIVSDNHIGISLNFIQKTNNAVINEANIIGGIVFGSTSASSCQDALDCHAFSSADIVGVGCNSVFGSAYRRVGIISSQYLNAAKTCRINGGVPSCVPSILPERLCSLPWEKRYGLPSSNYGKLVISNTVFGYFSSNDCGRISKAYMPNPSQIDYVPPAYFSGITWTNVGADAKIDLGLNVASAVECQSVCDSLNYAAAYDLDGTLFGKVGGTMFSQINPQLANTTNCVSDSNTKSIQCSTAFRPLSFENFDLDRSSRQLGSLQLSRISSISSISWAKGPYKDLCPLRNYFGQYPFLLEVGNAYNFTLEATMPATSRITYYSTNPNEAVLLNVFYSKPFVINVFVGGVQVTQSTKLPTLALPLAPAGSYAFDPQARQLTILLRGNANSPSQVYDFKTTNLVQLNLTSSIPLSQFSGDLVVQNLASLLNISASTIVVADVHPATVVRRDITASGTEFVVQIFDSVPVTADADVTANSVARLNGVVSQIQGLVSTGDFQNSLASIGVAVTSLIITPPDGNGVEVHAIHVNVGSPAPNDSSSSSSTQTIAVVVGVCAFVVILAVLLTVVYNRHQRSAGNDSYAFKSQVAPSSIVSDNGNVTTLLSRQSVGSFAVCQGQSPSLQVKQDDGTIHTYQLIHNANEQVSLVLPGAPNFDSLIDLVAFYSTPHDDVPFVLTEQATLFVPQQKSAFIV